MVPNGRHHVPTHCNGQDFTYEAVLPENSSCDPTQEEASDQSKSWDILQSLSTLKVSMS